MDSTIDIDCPDCEGEGVLANGDACANEEAFENQAGIHTVRGTREELEETYGLDLAEEGYVEEGAPDLETGPSLAPITSLASFPGEKSAEGLDWPDELIGVVTVGDDTGLSNRVNRSVGASEGPLTQAVLDEINERCAAAGIEVEPENAVVGVKWAVVLPEISSGYVGVEVLYLCKALGLEPKKTLTGEILDQLGADDVTVAVWAGALTR